MFEIATDNPGFVIDEAAAAMGKQLMLPPRHEPFRQALLQRLLEIT